MMPEIAFAVWHSREWAALIEAGYATMYVRDDGTAVMLYHKGRQ